MVSRRQQAIQVGCLVLAIFLHTTNGGSIRGRGGEVTQQQNNYHLYDNEQTNTAISSSVGTLNLQLADTEHQEEEEELHIITPYYDEITRRTVDSCLAASSSSSFSSPSSSNQQDTSKLPKLTVIQYYFAVESTTSKLHRTTIQMLETLLFHLISDKVMWCSLEKINDGGGGGRSRQLQQPQRRHLSDSIVSKIRQHHDNSETAQHRRAYALRRARQLNILMVNAAPNDLKTTIPCTYDNPPPQVGQQCTVYMGQMAILAIESDGLDEVVDAILDAIKETMDNKELVDPISMPEISNVRWLGVSLEEDILLQDNANAQESESSSTTEDLVEEENVDPFFNPGFGGNGNDDPNNNGDGDEDGNDVQDSESGGSIPNNNSDQFGDPEVEWEGLIDNADGLGGGDELPSLVVENQPQSENSEGSSGGGSDGDTTDNTNGSDSNQNGVEDETEQEAFDSTVGSGGTKEDIDGIDLGPDIDEDTNNNHDIPADGQDDETAEKENGLDDDQGTIENDQEGSVNVDESDTQESAILDQNESITQNETGDEGGVAAGDGETDGDSSGVNYSIGVDLGSSQNVGQNTGDVQEEEEEANLVFTDPFSSGSDENSEGSNSQVEGQEVEDETEPDSEGGDYNLEDAGQGFGGNHDWLEDSTLDDIEAEGTIDEDVADNAEEIPPSTLRGNFSDNSSGAVFLTVSLVPIAFAGGLIYVFFRQTRNKSDDTFVVTQVADSFSPFIGTGDPPDSFHEGHYHYTEEGSRYLSTNCCYCAETKRHGFFTAPCLSTIREGSSSGPSTNVSPRSSVTPWDDNGTLSYEEPCISMSSSYETDKQEVVEVSPRNDVNSYYQLMARAYGTVSPSSRQTPTQSNLSRTRPPSQHMTNEGQNSNLTMNYDDQLYGYDEPIDRPTSPSDASATLSYHSGLLSASSSGSTEDDDLENVNASLLGDFGTISNDTNKKESIDEISDLIDIPEKLNDFADEPTIPSDHTTTSSMSYLPNHLSPINNKRRIANNLIDRPSSPPLNAGQYMSTGTTFQEYMVDLDQMKQDAAL